MKDWIAGATNLKAATNPKATEMPYLFLIGGFFLDAPRSNQLFCVCKNRMMRLFNFSYQKYRTLQDQIHQATLKSHGMMAKEYNFY